MPDDAFIRLTHPSFPGSLFMSTVEAWEDTWSTEGWILAGNDIVATNPRPYHISSVEKNRRNGVAGLDNNGLLDPDVFPPEVLPGVPSGVYNATSYGTNGAAIQSAIDAAFAAGGGDVLVPMSTTSWWAVTTPIVLKSGVRIRGLGGRDISKIPTIRSDVGDVFTATGTVTGLEMSNVKVVSAAGGGHIINMAGFTASRWNVHDVFLLQDNNAKSVVRVTNEMLECTFSNLDVDHRSTATVPSFHLVSPINAINVNRWQSCRFTTSGDYSIHIESTGSSYCQDNAIRDCNFQQCEGGEIRLLSCRNTIVENCAAYDATAYNKDRVYVGKSTGPATSNTMLRNVVRRGAPTMTGVFDIRIVGGESARTTVISCNGKIDLGLTGGVIVMQLDSTAPAAVLTQLGPSAIVIDGGQIKPGAYATGSRPAATLVGEGAMIFDSTLNKPIWSDGTDWRDATGTAV